MNNEIDNSGPAFPCTAENFSREGMTLRDWFAGQALIPIGGYIAHGDITKQAKQHAMDLAAHAYNIADAMLAAREKGQP